MAQTDKLTHSLTEPLSTSLADPFYWGGAGSAETIPETVQNLIVVSAAFGVIHISWDANTDGANTIGYDIYRDTSSGATTKLGEVSVPNVEFFDTTPVVSTTYYYRVRGKSATSFSADYSNEVSDSVSDPLDPVPVYTLADAEAFYPMDNWSKLPDNESNDLVEVNNVAAWPDATLYSNSLNHAWTENPEGRFNVHSDMVTNGGFATDASWDFTGAYVSHSGGQAVWIQTGGGSGSVDQNPIDSRMANFRDWTSAMVWWDVVSQVSDGLRAGIGAESSPFESVNGSYEDIFTTNNQTGAFQLFGEGGSPSYVGNGDNAGAAYFDLEPGDYWVTGQSHSGNRIEDSVSLNLGQYTDVAWEMRLGSYDWSSNDRSPISEWVAGDRSWGFQWEASGQLEFLSSEDGTTLDTTLLSAGTSMSTLGSVDDKVWLPVWVRMEFDHDDGATQSRMRWGVSYDRNNGHAWEWSTWTNITTGLYEFHPATSGIDIGTLNAGTAAGFNGHIYEIYVYDGLTATTAPVYKFVAEEHNNDGSGFHDSTLTINRNNNQSYRSPYLVSRPDTYNLGFTGKTTVAWTSALTVVEDRTIALAFMRSANDYWDTTGDYFQQTDATKTILVTEEGSAPENRIELVISDGTNSLTTSVASYTPNEMQIVALSMDATNFYLHAGGNTITTARNTGSPGTVGDMDMASGDFEFWEGSGSLYAFAVWDVAMTDDAEFDGLWTAFNNSLSGDPPERNAREIDYGDHGGAGAAGGFLLDADTPVGSDTLKKISVAFDSNNGDGDIQVSITEMQIFASIDGTGTNLAENTATTLGTRGATDPNGWTEPQLAADYTNHPDYTYDGWEVFDGNTSTGILTALTEFYTATPITPSTCSVWVNFDENVVARSFKLYFDDVNKIPGTAQVTFSYVRADGSIALGPAIDITLTQSTGWQTFTIQ